MLNTQSPRIIFYPSYYNISEALMHVCKLILHKCYIYIYILYYMCLFSKIYCMVAMATPSTALPTKPAVVSFSTSVGAGYVASRMLVTFACSKVLPPVK